MTDSRDCIFLDRFKGDCVSSLPEGSTLIGRWLVAADDVFVNSAPASRGDFLVSELSGLWSVLMDDGQHHAGSITRAQLPDELEAKSIRIIGLRLDELIQRGRGWHDWLEVVPLAPGISEEVDLQPLERRIRENYGHIETVCRKPRAHLRVEVERVPVSSARRIPPNATSYLASHTEDWERPLLRGIMPKRVLAETRQDQLDIYENRVAARLLDNLIAYLNRRIQVLQRLLKLFKDKEDFSSDIGGTWQRKMRISELWGRSVDANEGQRQAEITLKELEWQKYKLMGLFSSVLYQEVPQRAFVPATLKSTNILTNDQHYRRVADLWREWARIGVGQLQSPAELYAEAQRLCHGLDTFAMLLTVRALDMLGYEPIEEVIVQGIMRGNTIPIQGRGVSIVLTWRKDGTIAVSMGDRILTIVTLAADMGAGNDEQVRQSLERVRVAADERSGGGLLVLFLASEDAWSVSDINLLKSLHTVGNDPRHRLAGVACLPVSPWEIGTTERVARALRWFLTSTCLSEYPQRVEVPPEVSDLIEYRDHSKWLVDQVSAKGMLVLQRPPEDYEWQRLDIQCLVQKSSADHGQAQSEHARISAELNLAARNRCPTGTLKQHKHTAHEKVIRSKYVAMAVDRLAKSLEDAKVRSYALLICPSCGKSADPGRDFIPRDRESFECGCNECSTKWGMRLCSNGHRFAVMLPGGKFIDTNDSRPGWEDRVYGCDLLAIPARTPNGSWGFVCPECGQLS